MKLSKLGCERWHVIVPRKELSGGVVLAINPSVRD
jgi:hypothetical protein